ncbi:MAG: DNA-binding response regulator [Pirellulaceae bacterium]|nr:MAG: DNA-binding response regulator [Pirellulaceae bacterium]
MPVRVLIADDHEVVRQGLRAVLRGENIEVVGEAKNGSEVVSQAVKCKPDVVLMDVRMPDVDGLDGLDKLRRKLPNLPVVMISSFENPTYVARSVALGASDFLLKGASRAELVAAIQRAARREPAPEGSAFDEVKRSLDKRAKTEAPDWPLTQREIQVLRHIAMGLSNREIGRSLGISVETVKEHVQNILRKLQAVDRTQAAVWAVKKGLV